MVGLMNKAMMAAFVGGFMAVATPAQAADAFAPSIATSTMGLESSAFQISLFDTDESNASYRDRDRGKKRNYNRGRNARYDRYYDGKGNYSGPSWRDNNGRYRCRRPDGTVGALIGGALGGVLGNEVAGRNDKTVGTIVGAAGGAILGREIERGGSRCR